MDVELRESLAGMRVLPWGTYRLPAALERNFAEATDLERNHQIRSWVVAGLVFSWLNFATDLVAVPDVWRLSLLLHLFIVTPVACVAIRVLRTIQASWLQTAATVAPPGASLLAVLLVLGASAHVDTFRSAIILPLGILWMNVLIPMRMRDAWTFTLAMLALGTAINLFAADLHGVQIDQPEIVASNYVLAGLSLLGRFLAERDTRRSFLHGLRLQLRAEDLARANATLLDMSNTDPLTGLANRRFFDQALARAWQEAAAEQGSMALLMIDVDHFKLFNDTAGHLEGDRCLTIIARTVAEQVRRGHDLAARFGGEEFVVLMPATDEDAAHDIAERVRTTIAALRVFHPGRIGQGFVSVSIGVAAMRPAPSDATPARLLDAADRALYAAKRAGRDRVVHADRLRQDAGAT